MKTAREYRMEAKQMLTGNWGMAILIYLVFGILLGAASSTLVGGLILGGAFTVGLATSYIHLFRRNTLDIGDLFVSFNSDFPNTIIMWLLYNIFVFLWSLLLFIPGIIATYAYAMAPYILADNPGMDGMEALSTSKRLMNGKKWKLFCLDFSFIGWLILCVLTAGILTLWVAPWQQAAHAAFYESIKAEVPDCSDYAKNASDNNAGNAESI